MCNIVNHVLCNKNRAKYNNYHFYQLQNFTTYGKCIWLDNPRAQTLGYVAEDVLIRDLLGELWKSAIRNTFWLIEKRVFGFAAK